MDDLNICLDEKYLPEAEVLQLKESAWRVQNVIHGYGRYLRQRQGGATAALHDEVSEYDPNPDPFFLIPSPAATDHPTF